MLNPKETTEKVAMQKTEPKTRGKTAPKTRGKATRANGAATKTAPVKVANTETETDDLLYDVNEYPEVLVSMGPPQRPLTIEEYDRLDKFLSQPGKRNPALAALLADSRKHITHG